MLPRINGFDRSIKNQLLYFVKNPLRRPISKLSDSIDAVVEFVEEHPGSTIKDVSMFLNIESYGASTRLRAAIEDGRLVEHGLKPIRFYIKGYEIPDKYY